MMEALVAVNVEGVRWPWCLPEACVLYLTMTAYRLRLLTPLVPGGECPLISKHSIGAGPLTSQ